MLLAIYTDGTEVLKIRMAKDDEEIDHLKSISAGCTAGNIDIITVPISVAIAAPELLEACIKAAKYGPSMDMKTIQVIQQAIAKAEGNQ